MRIECSKCGDLIDTTAKTVVAPFICGECNCDCETCKPTPTTGPFDIQKLISNPSVVEALRGQGLEVDTDAVEGVLGACETATVENTTLLIEDLQQQLQDERATVLALKEELTQTKEIYEHVNDELVIARQNFLEASKQVITLDDRNLRQHLSIAMYQEQEENLIRQIENLKTIGHNAGRQANELYAQNQTLKDEVSKLLYRALYNRVQARLYFRRLQEEMGKVWDLKNHPIREYFKNVWADSREK